MSEASPLLRYYDMAPGVTAFSTTRQGGYGHGAYGGMNVNRWCGDDPATVARNKEMLLDVLTAKARETRHGHDNRHNCGTRRALSLIMPHQTHGTRIACVTDRMLTLPVEALDKELEDTDALMTDVTDVCIGVSTADCIPLLLYDAEHRAACAIHAGWRGTVARIAEKSVSAMTRTYGTDPSRLHAVIGPGISPEAFEVGDEVYETFRNAGFAMEHISHRETKWHIDLWECNRRQLTGAGITPCNIATDGTCTYNNPETFFSARRLGTASGRILTGIIINSL